MPMVPRGLNHLPGLYRRSGARMCEALRGATVC
jgi:hypothetical protein